MTSWIHAAISVAGLAKLVAESMLSLYPVFVKQINLPLLVQMWSRFFTYAVVSFGFVEWVPLMGYILSIPGLLLGVVTMIHIYTSYRGFQLVESGVAYALFYLYPIIILIMAGNMQSWGVTLVALIGAGMLAMSQIQSGPIPVEGFLMVCLAAFTEAWIYFLVRDIPSKNPWNHMLISYLPGAVILTLLVMAPSLIPPGLSTTAATAAAATGTSLAKGTSLAAGTSLSTGTSLSRVWISMGINAIIGLFGYLLRFFAMIRLPPLVYAPLSYFGIVMAFVYGVLLENEPITWTKGIGAFFIIASNAYILFHNRESLRQ